MVDGGLLLPPLHVLLLCQLRPRCQSGVVEDSLEGPAEGEATGNADGTDGIKSISVLHDTQRGGALLPPPPPAPCKLVLETHALHHLEHGTSPSLPVAVFLEEGAGGRRPGFLAPAVLPIPSCCTPPSFMVPLSMSCSRAPSSTVSRSSAGSPSSAASDSARVLTRSTCLQIIREGQGEHNRKATASTIGGLQLKRQALGGPPPVV
mmetsp:Transcript_5647/g.19124  ORF Transcript_5647/g.19124 Transcript_5647/m.19124 type:complete len:206 (-) Transcript_5647:262-879(-)